MFQQIGWIILIIGIVSLCHTARVANRSFPRKGIQESFENYLMRENIINSLTKGNYDVTGSVTIRNSTFEPESDITFYLFTRDNPDEAYELRMNDTENLAASPFDPERITKIIVHGYAESKDTRWVGHMRKNYLNVDDYNVIAVDWSPANFPKFSVVARMTREMGEYVGDFLGYLRSEGNLSYPDVHILGYSVGGHIAGCAGAAASGQIGRITGLDVTRPGFEVPVLKNENNRLDPSDAGFVDVIHTCAGTAGFVEPIGHVDFYPNGGSFRQPGCPLILSQACSHLRAPQFMVESIAASTYFLAIKCDTWDNYRAGKCFDNPISVMGENVNPEARGKFFLETNSESPFARGIEIFGDLISQTIA